MSTAMEELVARCAWFVVGNFQLGTKHPLVRTWWNRRTHPVVLTFQMTLRKPAHMYDSLTVRAPTLAKAAALALRLLDDGQMDLRCPCGVVVLDKVWWPNSTPYYEPAHAPTLRSDWVMRPNRKARCRMCRRETPLA